MHKELKNTCGKSGGFKDDALNTLFRVNSLEKFSFSSEVLKIYIIFYPQSELATFKLSFLLWTVISLQPVGISF